MKNLYFFISSFLLVFATGAFAEEAELLDAYLEDLPGTSNSQNVYSDNVVHQPQVIKYKRVDTSDDSELYEAVYVDQSANMATKESSNSNVLKDYTADPNQQTHIQEDLEIIELEPDEGDIAIIEAPDIQITQTGTADSTVSGPIFCQQNPYARECLLSKYLSLCKKDPQSADCKSELQKFDRFCGIFPNAYKCKKAKIAASCKKAPDTDECRTLTQRYCQKFPKAIFCKYN